MVVTRDLGCRTYAWGGGDGGGRRMLCTGNSGGGVRVCDDSGGSSRGFCVCLMCADGCCCF